MYNNAIVIPAGHDRIDIHTNSIYTNNSGYTWNQGNGWATSQPMVTLLDQQKVDMDTCW